MTAPTHPVDVLLLLTHADHVLLALREGTGYADGQWNLPSGKLELNEDAISGLVREAREEIRVRLDPAEPRMVTTVHHRNTVGLARVGLAFAVTFDPARHGEPINTEPHKCAKIEWFPGRHAPVEHLPLHRRVRPGPSATACRSRSVDGHSSVVVSRSGWCRGVKL